MLIVNIKRTNRSIKILVAAERNEEEKKTRVLDYGANEFVLKPLGLETIVQKLNTILAEEDLKGKRAKVLEHKLLEAQSRHRYNSELRLVLHVNSGGTSLYIPCTIMSKER
jgi:DNA-binding response OmpR family regulator